MTRPRRYIRHLTVDTGHVRDSYRAEIRDDVIAVLRPLLERAAAGHVVDVPGEVRPAGCRMVAVPGRDRGLRVTVSAPAMGSSGPSLDPLVTFGVAPSSLAGAALWSEWGREGEPPAAPWCATVLRGGLVQHPEAAAWLGDYERCCAWAWIDAAP